MPGGDTIAVGHNCINPAIVVAMSEPLTAGCAGNGSTFAAGPSSDAVSEEGPMAGIADVARLAGVSKSTASRALTGSGYVSDETRLRVQDVAASLGYTPTTSAVSLVTGRTRTIGVVLPALSRWFFARVLEGIQDALLERRYD